MLRIARGRLVVHQGQAASHGSRRPTGVGAAHGPSAAPQLLLRLHSQKTLLNRSNPVLNIAILLASLFGVLLADSCCGLMRDA
jgi:hypothetical protein